MQRIMFVGESGSGKRDLIGSLLGQDISKKRAMAVQYHGPLINTPGEFLEHPGFHHALITISFECDIICFVQNAIRVASVFPPQFGSMFNRRVVGVVTRVDDPKANVERAERFLNTAGVQEYVRVDVACEKGMTELRSIGSSL